MKLSFDAGFGDTKYILEKDNGEIIKEKFPTAIEKVSIKAKGDKDVYNFGGRVSYYRVGERAVRNASITRDMEYLIKISPLLLYHILKKNGIKNLEEPLNIKTGVSLFYYNEYKDKFRKALKEFEIDGKQITAEVGIFAQGQGILYDYLDKNDVNDNEIVIVDIGYNTIDFLHFIKENNQFRPFKDNCFGIAEGAYLAVSELKDFIEDEFDKTITEQEANRILQSGLVKTKGENIDISDVVEEIKVNYTDRIMNDIIKVRTKLIDNVDKIVFGGGGAYFLDEKELNKYHKGFTIIEEPEFANVRGYLKKIKGE